MDVQAARTNMLKQQLRTSGVNNDALLTAIDSVARELFVPASYYHVAYADMVIPLAHGQAMLSPTVEAQILQTTAIQPYETVLEIGTGTGYLTAILAQLAHTVSSIDIFPDFIEMAKENLSQLGVSNIALQVANGMQEWQCDKTFDVIIVSGSLYTLPKHLEKQLNIGGRLFAVIGQAPTMEAYLIKRINEQQYQYNPLFETVLPYLLEIPQPEAFVF